MNHHRGTIIDEICEKDLRYKADAYDFILEALSYTQKKFSRQRHVSGEELLQGIKDLLLEKFGPMALQVLQHWGIKSTDDFGHIVFNLVSNKLLSKTEEDTLESFKNRYDFQQAFHVEYRQQLEKKLSRMRSF